MTSTYTPLGVEKMVTGENAGTWGTKTNTNLQLIEQLAAGYQVQTLNAAGAGANTTTLAVSDGSTGATLASRIIILGEVKVLFVKVCVPVVVTSPIPMSIISGLVPSLALA